LPEKPGRESKNAPPEQESFAFLACYSVSADAIEAITSGAAGGNGLRLRFFLRKTWAIRLHYYRATDRIGDIA
jgi:hypothetical protein